MLIRAVAGLLVKHMPSTYACNEVMETEQFGQLPMAKAKGEGEWLLTSNPSLQSYLY